MKKTVSIIAFVLLSVVGANAQGFKIGVHVGYPIGDAADLYSVQAGADVAYTWEVSDSFYAGVTTGYGIFLGTDLDTAIGTMEIPNFSFVPIAATAAYGFGENWFGGADIGYAVNAGEGSSSGGILYQPKFGYKGESLEAYAFYKSMSIESVSISSVGAGVAWRF
ncbi:MAG TPA: hypothetical protein VK010_04205 [Flavobacteriaceae bacterium]|nr:hypothetical protein [Flavobacteriaceae bacterium]